MRDMDDPQKENYDRLPGSVIKPGLRLRYFGTFFMDLIGFLKMVPAVIGIAGLLTYFMRAREPVPDHKVANFLQSARNTVLLLGFAALIMLSAWLIFRPAPPDRDAALLHGPAQSRPA